MASVLITNLATALLLLLGIASEAGCTRTQGLESLKRTPHSLFIDTKTKEWRNSTNLGDSNKILQNNTTLGNPFNQISLKEYFSVNFNNLKRNDSITYSLRNLNVNNKNIIHNNTTIINNKSSDINMDDSNSNNSNSNKKSNSIKNQKSQSIIDNKLLFMNAFKKEDFTPHNNKSPHLQIDAPSKINNQLVDTWAKMRRSAVLSSDSMIIPQTDDGVHEADKFIEARRLGKRSEVAEDLRQRFNIFKEFLATTTNTSPSNTDVPLRGTENLFGERRKTVRKAGELIGMVESGALPASEHPILFLPTPQRTVIGPSPRQGGHAGATIGQTAGRTGPVGGSFTGRLRLGSSRTPPPHISRMPLHYVNPLQSQPGMSPELVRLLQARLGTTSRRVHYDSSIIVDFLTLVSLSQRHNSGDSGDDGRSRTSQREVSQFGSSSDLTSSPPMSSRRSTSSHQLNSGHHHQGEFGPFSNGNDPSAGIDPSNIAFPPQLRQTLYSYLLPRLPALGALLDTVPGVPGLDYPIIAAVPYTNFYCLDMPWPGFYADTEARCQTWHYCDLEGRQSSFLCPNGTVFNQAFLVCDWWYNFDCQTAPFLYSINERIFDVPEVDETAPHRTLTPEILDTLFV